MLQRHFLKAEHKGANLDGCIRVPAGGIEWYVDTSCTTIGLLPRDGQYEGIAETVMLASGPITIASSACEISKGRYRISGGYVPELIKLLQNETVHAYVAAKPRDLLRTQKLPELHPRVLTFSLAPPPDDLYNDGNGDKELEVVVQD